jgi:hypothetical protein
MVAIMLIKERNDWKDNFKNNQMPKSCVLEVYRCSLNTKEKKLPYDIEEVCAYILYLEGINIDNIEILSPELQDKKNYWDNKFKNGYIPKAKILMDYREYRNSELHRTTRLIEEICEYVLYLEEKVNRI